MQNTLLKECLVSLPSLHVLHILYENFSFMESGHGKTFLDQLDTGLFYGAQRDSHKKWLDLLTREYGKFGFLTYCAALSIANHYLEEMKEHLSIYKLHF